MVFRNNFKLNTTFPYSKYQLLVTNYQSPIMKKWIKYFLILNCLSLLIACGNEQSTEKATEEIVDEVVDGVEDYIEKLDSNKIDN